MKIEIELPEIPGYEYTGEFRKATYDEYYLDIDTDRFLEYNEIRKTEYSYPILKKLDDPKLPKKDRGRGVGVAIKQYNQIIDYLKHLKERIDELES